MAVRLMLDARKVGDGGIGAYLENLLAGLWELRREGSIDLDCSLLLPPAERRSTRPDTAETLRCWESRWDCVVEPAGKYSVSEYFLLPLRHRRLLSSVDLFHSPHYTLPFFLGVPAVATIHDVIHLQFPESELTRLAAKRLITSTLRRAAAVLTVSRHSRRMIREHIRGALPPVFVTPNAAAEWYSSTARADDVVLRAALGAGGPYCLFVGSDRRHKGFDILVDGWRRLHRGAAAAAGDGLQLIVVGERFADGSRAAAAEAAGEHTVRFIDRASDRELATLYRGARAVIVSSGEEGFGLPALEAAACGAPAVSTPLASVREVCGDAPYYASAFDGSALCAALQTALERPAAAAPWDRAEQFTCRRQAELTCAAYESVLWSIGRYDKVIRRAVDAGALLQSAAGGS